MKNNGNKRREKGKKNIVLAVRKGYMQFICQLVSKSIFAHDYLKENQTTVEGFIINNSNYQNIDLLVDLCQFSW
jgi:hypothetical protein